MTTLKTIMAVAALTAMPAAVAAHDFAVPVTGATLYFNVTDTVTPAVTLTYEGSIASGKACTASGQIEIPAKVRNDGTVYAVTAIGPKAFSGATSLTAVIMPSTVSEIGDFAFEKCTCLERIVYPGKQVKLGQGVFFRCTSIRDISFGSDWHTIDFKPYRWSDSLKTLRVPAKVGKLHNMKSLAVLEAIYVDANNARFSSYKGVLYDKGGKVLYGAPRSYKGTLRIKEGTEKVLPGALIDCPQITKIDVPATVRSMSFRETSRMETLAEVILRSSKPITTAYKNGEGTFLLQVANQEVKLTVAKGSKKVYASLLAADAGEYCESQEAGCVAYPVREEQMPSAKNLKGVKDISSYE